MRRDLADLCEVLKEMKIEIHIHHDGVAPGGCDQRHGYDPSDAMRAEEVRAVTKLLSRSRLKLQSALASAGVPVVRGASPHPEVTLSKVNPLDQAIADLTAEVTESVTVEESAVTLINGIPALIDNAVAKAIAAGATPAQLGALTGLSQQLKAEATKLSAAVVANTSTAGGPTLSLTPTSGFDGTTVVIAGTGFGAAQGSGRVTFAGKPAPVITWSDTSITVTVPAGSSPGPSDLVVDVVVTTTAGPSATAQFRVTQDPNTN